MRAYLAAAGQSFRKNLAFRSDYLLGILNTVLQIFISCAIWKALYGQRAAIGGISFPMVATNFVIGLGLTNAYAADDSAVQRRLNDGSMANELLKPVDFRALLLAENLGNIFFRLMANVLPATLIAAVLIGFLPPASPAALALFAASAALGFLVFWSISSVIQMAAFWIMNVWSVSTIANVFINILSGAMLPLWFMPKPILAAARFTPFDSIYFIPVRIYLGQLSGWAALPSFGRQALWAAAFFGASSLMWAAGKRRVILQGG
jgi:ABC-2 type transport system permease protein